MKKRRSQHPEFDFTASPPRKPPPPPRDDGDYDGDDGNDNDSEFPDTASFGMVRRYFNLRVDEGLRCPLCRQYAKVYKRKLNKTMMKTLRLLYKSGAVTHYVHGPTVLTAFAAPARETGKLALFNLVEENTRRREDGGKSGWWRITPDGELFLRGKLKVKKYAIVYNGICRGFKGEDIDIMRVAPEFRLDDLMNDQ